jgi:hypothetical protein
MPYFALVVADAEKASAAARAVRQVGDLWTTAEADCPEGRPNCRQCGDPAQATACAAAGHCPDCGTRHGIAPDAVLAAKGLTLRALAGPPAPGAIWDRVRRVFVPRKAR